MTRTILTEAGAQTAPSGDALWLSAADALRITGWELKPEGMCRGELCVPLPAGMARDGQIDVAAFWGHIGAPLAHDAGGIVWSLGTAASERRQSLETLAAPDFTLPDLAGAAHSLSDLRGKKTLLVTWASW